MYKCREDTTKISRDGTELDKANYDNEVFKDIELEARIQMIVLAKADFQSKKH